jgi:hypothetical protein
MLMKNYYILLFFKSFLISLNYYFCHLYRLMLIRKVCSNSLSSTSSSTQNSSKFSQSTDDYLLKLLLRHSSIISGIRFEVKSLSKFSIASAIKKLDAFIPNLLCYSLYSSSLVLSREIPEVP